MNLNFTLPIRSRPSTFPTKAADRSYDNQTVLNPRKSDLRVKKREPAPRQNAGCFENIRPETS
ncbi:hypothetical protein FSST1_000780 [Fusarium sambucinum]